MVGLPSRVPAGILLPESVLQSEFFQVLATFVAINTLLYVTLAVAKMLPRLHPGDWFRGRNRRREPRGINPGALGGHNDEVEA